MEHEQPIICHADGLSLPARFLDRMRSMLGEDFDAFCAAYQKPLHPSLRVNALKVSPDRFKELAPFVGAGVPWQENGFYYGATADGEEVRPGKHPFHEAGLYYIQEASAMLPASLCPPRPGERVLDLCAAPGGKTTQLAAALGGEGLLVANEIHPARAAILSRNVERMGVRNAVVTNESPARLAARFPAFFDKIVVDAPCSGEGMFRKEADAVTMWSQENVALCAARQAEILDEAAKMLRAGGYLVYSTCTFAPAENEGTVLDFLRRHPDFDVVPSEEPLVRAAREAGLLDGGHPTWADNYADYEEADRAAVRQAYRVFPHHCDGEGHFAVLLRRRADADAGAVALSRATGKRKGDRRDGKGGGKMAGGKGTPSAEAVALALFADFAREVLGGTPAWIDGTVPCLFGDKLYFVPAALGSDVRGALDGLRVLRAGLCAGTVIGLGQGRSGRFEPDHALALAAIADGTERVFPALYDAAIAYLRGETLPADGRNGWHLVTYCGFPLGWGKASDRVMKNHYPKGLRWS